LKHKLNIMKAKTYKENGEALYTKCFTYKQLLKVLKKGDFINVYGPKVPEENQLWVVTHHKGFDRVIKEGSYHYIKKSPNPFTYDN
jgi:hypothetical protein